MKQRIKSTAHSLVQGMGLPLHRIAFAWTGERSTSAHELIYPLASDADPFQLIKNPSTIHQALLNSPPASLLLIASGEETSGGTNWHNGHALLLGPPGISDLTNGPAIFNYMRRLTRQFQAHVCRGPSALDSPIP